MRNDIIPGARFPDYQLTDHTEADRAHSHVIELNSSHAIPITYPDVVVDVIEQAARATTK